MAALLYNYFLAFLVVCLYVTFGGKVGRGTATLAPARPLWSNPSSSSFLTPPRHNFGEESLSPAAALIVFCLFLVETVPCARTNLTGFLACLGPVFLPLGACAFPQGSAPRDF